MKEKVWDVKVHTTDRSRSFIFIIRAASAVEAESMGRNAVMDIDPKLEIREVKARESELI